MAPEPIRGETTSATSPPGTAARMTRARAARLARQARQYGYFSLPDGHRVTCPQCRGPVTATRNYREFPARPGKPANVRPDGTRYTFRQETAVEALDRAVADHLLNWCEAGMPGGGPR
jgi:hypothetical protein